MTAPLSLNFSTTLKGKADTAVVFVTKGNTLSPAAETLDKDSGGLIAAYLKRQKSFAAKLGQTLVIAAAPKQPFARIILVGLDDPAKLTAANGEVIGAKLYAALTAAGAEHAVITLDDDKAWNGVTGDAILANIAMGLKLATYKFDQYRSKKKDAEPAPELAKITFTGKSAAKGDKTFAAMDSVATGVFLARDLTNLPPNVLYPDTYAKRIKAELAPLGVKVEILDEKKMQQMGFGAHLAVGQGSAFPPRVVIMQWNGTGKTSGKNGPVALVGKGITFDTGGISIKPAGGMDEMKMDMGGSAAVVGTMKALALRKAKANVVGIVALAENMPSDRAYRPGDIITSLSGKTIEVLNTDAEGRLVLCDSLTHVQNTFKPRLIIDLATLTGAIIVALGQEYCGSFVNDDNLWSEIDAAGKATGEKYWRMPLDEAYRKDMESKVADLRNIGTPGKAGSCTAAGFLEAFIEPGTPWAHLDIAGTAMKGGGTGFGVRTLDRLIADNYEK